MSEVARTARVGLCLKHYPGIGGANVNSHQDFMDISDALSADQEELFYALAPKMFGDAVLISHAIVRQWDRDNPATLSPAAIGRLRARLAETLLITDDMQMQGLQKALGTRAASLRSLAAGIDMLCIGNNLFDQEAEMIDIAEDVERGLRRRSAGFRRHRRFHRSGPQAQGPACLTARRVDRPAGCEPAHTSRRRSGL